MRYPRIIVAIWLVTGALLAINCAAAGPDPRAALYGAEWARCSVDNDAAAEARACMRAVNRIYGQDAGLK